MPPVVHAVGGIFLALIVGGFLFDRLMLWMERKGWVYWRVTKPNVRSAGSAFLELQSLLEPEKQYVLEARREEDASVEERSDHFKSEGSP